MTKQQQSRLTRLKKVSALLERYQDDWQQEPSIVMAVDELNGDIAFLTQAFTRLSEGTKSLTHSKEQELLRLQRKLAWLSALLYTWADHHGDAELMNLTDVAPSHYQKMSDETFIAAFHSLVQRASELGGDQLGAYGADEPVLNELRSEAALLGPLLSSPQLTVGALKALRTEVQLRLRKSSHRLKRKIVKLFLPYQSLNPGLWLALQAALVIFDPKTRPREEDSDSSLAA